MNNDLSLTEAAIKQLEKLCAEHQGLLININTTGCSGYAYDLKIITQTEKDDIIYPQANHRFIAINKKNLPFVIGSKLDYVREGINARFKFINPNEKGTCGCGESFTV